MGLDTLGPGEALLLEHSLTGAGAQGATSVPLSSV